MNKNPLLNIDFYKADHRSQYPEGTELVYSNFTPRKSRLPHIDHMVFFGLQYALREYLLDRMDKHFFRKPKELVVREYKRRMDFALGVDSISVDHIEALHDLGYLPLHIKALPEGTKVPLGVPAMTMKNTHPDFFWVTNYFETMLSALLWKPCTSATTANEFKRKFVEYALHSGAPLDMVQFQGHDFSFRGMSGIEDGCMSGAGHLLSFSGTDTLPAIDFLEDYYFADAEKELIGCSVPATEHSVMCAGGKDGEFETLKRLVCDIYPSGIVSVVSDTWDLWQLLTDYLPRLKDEISNRDGKVVIRPDSGTPHLIVNGDPQAETEVERKGVVRLLDETFGHTVNDKGFKELNHVGVIYGDGIDHNERNRILDGLVSNGYVSTSVVMGLGSFTYQYVTRDTLGTVCKATHVTINGKDTPIFKDPVTGGWKKSHKGLLRVDEEDGKIVVKQDVTWEEEKGGLLEDKFINGQLFNLHTLEDIRARLA